MLFGVLPIGCGDSVFVFVLLIMVPCVGLRCVEVVFPDHTHSLFYSCIGQKQRAAEI